jgi:hypothetical protein
LEKKIVLLTPSFTHPKFGDEGIPVFEIPMMQMSAMPLESVFRQNNWGQKGLIIERDIC